MKRICLYFFLLLSFLLSPIEAYAQNQTPTTTPPPGSEIPRVDSPGSQTDFDDFLLDPPQFPQNDDDLSYITDFTNEVTVTFPGLPDGDYEICLQNNYCVSDPGIVAFSTANSLLNYVSLGVPEDKLSDLKDADDILEGNSLTVCGDGNRKLKTDCDDDDYFHAGSFYLITVYDSQSDNKVAVARAGFYVSHGIPDVDVEPNINLTPTGQKFEVSISQSKMRADGDGKRNNYQVVLEAPGYKNEDCGTVKNTTEPLTFKFPAGDDGDLQDKGFTVPGLYTFKINEQNDEGGRFGTGFGDSCNGGFTYMHINCTIGTDNNKNKCLRIDDPRGEDAKELLNLLNIINGEGEQGVDLPCNKNNPFVKNPLDCNSIDTSIGPIAVDPIGFVTRIFSIVLSLAGLGAMILIIFSGYRLLISRGDKEKIQGARETLTSAIIGLLFIIFSLVILSVIAGNILKIPGFS